MSKFSINQYYNNTNKSYNNYPPSYDTKSIVNCVIKESKKVYCGVAGFISFDYNPNLINIVKSAPERLWHKETKEWEVAYNYLDNILNNIREAGHTVHVFDERKNKEADYEIINPTIQIPEDYEFKTQPWGEFQKEGVLYGLNHDKFILGDSQGCGKTWQALQIACIRKRLKGYKHCLIICCVNPNKYNWLEEIEKHTNEKGYILGTRFRKKTGRTYIGSNEDKLYDIEHMNDCFFQITNIETLRYAKQIETKTRTGLSKKKSIYPIVDKLKELVDSNEIGYIITDEIHICRNSNSAQGDALLSLSSCDNVCMSGTLLLNSPVDLYTPLRMVGAENHSVTQYKQHYCVFGGYGGYQIVSYKNLAELQMLLDGVMIRRLKKDVLDLPPKIDTVKYVELDTDQQAIYDEIKEQTIENISEYLQRSSNIDRVSNNMTPLSMLIRMRQATGNPAILTTKKISNAKFNMLKLIAEELKNNNEKFIVYSNWTGVLNDAYALLQGIGMQPALYTGENIKEREADKSRFRSDPNCRCICGTIDAMGTGHTLTEATTVIFLDEPWNRGKKEQAEDRAHRIGTKSSINIITLIAKDTIDERIHEVVYKKGKMSDVIVDKEIDIVNNEKLVQYLLS